MKKFLLTILISLVLFFSFASQSSIKAQIIEGQNLSGGCVSVPSNKPECTGSLTVACSQVRPPAGNISRWCCDTQASCDAAKGVVQQEIAGQLASSSPTQKSSWYDQSFTDWFAKVYDTNNPSEIFGERYTAAQVQWVVYGLFSMLIPGKDVVACVLSGDISTCVGQLFGSATPQNNVAVSNESFISSVFSSNRPISLISYTQDLTKKITLVEEVRAQETGFGFSQLNLIQDFWASIRNSVYGLFVIFTIIFAFMIMFRVKINPQTVITVQSAIPKLILALIFVTFSFAIAGLMIDLMYVVIGLFSLLMANSGNFFASDPLTIFRFMTTGYVGLNSAIGVPLGIFGLFIIHVITFSTILLYALLGQNGGLGFLAAQIGTLGLYGTIIGLLSLLAFVILMVIEIWMFFKVMWMLIKTFAQVLLNVIFGPFQIALGTVIPNLGFGSWLKSLAAGLAVFPISGILLAMSFAFLKLAGTAANDAFRTISLWDLLGIIPGGIAIESAALSNGWPPLLSGPRGMLGLIYLGVSLVLITLIPKTVEIIQGFITGRPFAYGTAIGESFGPIKGAYGATVGPVATGFQKYGGEELSRAMLRRIGTSNIIPEGSVKDFAKSAGGLQPNTNERR